MTDVRQFIHQAQRDDEEAQAEALATKLGLQYVNLTAYEVAPTMASVLAAADRSSLYLVPYRRTKSVVEVASPEPQNPALTPALAAISQSQSLPTQLAVCSASSFAFVQAQLEAFEVQAQAAPQRAPVSQSETDESLSTFRDPKILAAKLLDISTSEQLDILFAGALGMQATDIHIEPGERDVLIRYRIDGVLQEIARLPLAHYKTLRSRIKYLAKLTLDVEATPQDGRFSYQVLGTTFDVRVSSLPSGYGETFVLRLLLGGSIITLDSLGFTPEQVAIVRTAIAKPNGLILNTGPTGSGKTTTLYAILAELNKPSRKIITIEDPIEYRVDGIEQSQVKPESGYTFATALRSALRQDPDIIMVGEIRDPETATIAIQAAMTGHLVLATLHTNSAAGAIPRLLDMGVKTYLLGGVINLIIGQRLVRKLVDPAAQGDTRYKGRVAIAELLVPNEEIETLMQQKASVDDFEQAALAAGMVPLFTDGMSKVKAGLTTEEEIRRVAQDVAT